MVKEKALTLDSNCFPSPSCRIFFTDRTRRGREVFTCFILAAPGSLVVLTNFVCFFTNRNKWEEQEEQQKQGRRERWIFLVAQGRRGSKTPFEERVDFRLFYKEQGGLRDKRKGSKTRKSIGVTVSAFESYLSSLSRLGPPTNCGTMVQLRVRLELL